MPWSLIGACLMGDGHGSQLPAAKRPRKRQSQRSRDSTQSPGPSQRGNEEDEEAEEGASDSHALVPPVCPRTRPKRLPV